MRLVNCRQSKTNPSTKLGAGKQGINIFPYIFDFDKLTFENDAPIPVICKTKKQNQSVRKIGVLFVLVGIIWMGISAIPGTVAYFSDSEISKANFFAAALLDFELESVSDFTPEVSKHKDAHRDVSVVDINSIAFHYQVHAESFIGDLCDTLTFAAFLQGDEKYLGPIKNFQAGDFGFSDPEDWHFAASISEKIQNSQCSFDLVFSGWQIEFPFIFSGFHEKEILASVITTKVVPPKDDKCEDSEGGGNIQWEDEDDDKGDKGDKSQKPDKPDKCDKKDKGDKGDKPDKEDEENAEGKGDKAEFLISNVESNPNDGNEPNREVESASSTEITDTEESASSTESEQILDDEEVAIEEADEDTQEEIIESEEEIIEQSTSVADEEEGNEGQTPLAADTNVEIQNNEE